MKFGIYLRRTRNRILGAAYLMIKWENIGAPILELFHEDEFGYQKPFCIISKEHVVLRTIIHWEK